MGSLKAPGSDGFQALFFKHYWHIVGDDIWGTSSFILGRGTVDNAIILQEIVHHMSGKRNRNQNIIFKLDLEKAYDSVNWDFLRETLQFFGFPSATIDLIMLWVTSSSLTLLWYGMKLDPFAPSRGLRQGDPLSPYLFVLCMERLAILIQDAAKVSQMQMVHNLLSQFCLASSLRINVARSRAYVGGGVDRARRARIFSVTEIPFTSHLDKIGRKLAAWKGKLLNKAGKITLVKSVLNAIPVYPMQLFWFPQAVCDRIDNLARNFIWSRGDRHGMHLVSWKKITMAKRFGGLGVRQARPTNVAMLGKLAGFSWRVGAGAVSFWYDSWCSLRPLCLLVPYVHISDSALRVCDVFRDGVCELRRLATPLTHEFSQKLLSLCVFTDQTVPDLRVWASSTDGLYIVAGCYDWLMTQRTEQLPTVPWGWI
ncbi:uncharacterized protein LOC130733345 [Lotus japonicus]|uniref:uncharacterized protein LOC130733345 n=1 Tax=Lotus japonicus TaxID=34305 RepID=UPI00258BB998|nr:uncharacterized protein LOC130733345 [Lotus japonicus]